MNYLKLLRSNQNYFEDFITRSIYHSNAIEGNTLSIYETFALLFDHQYCHIENASAREIYEVINHKYALNHMLNSMILFN